MDRELFIVRHGEVLPSKSPMNPIEGLSVVGVNQATELSHKLNKLKFSKVFSSNTKRTIQTAKLVFGAREPEIIAGLEERDWGDSKFKEWSEIKAILDQLSYQERRLYRPNNGESWEDFENRLIGAFAKLAKDNFDRAVLFSHMGVMRALLPIIAPNDFTREGLTKVEFENCEVVRLRETRRGTWYKIE